MRRTPCCGKGGLKSGPWTPEEDKKLIAYVTQHGHGNWQSLPARAGLERCGKSCRLRWINYLKPDIKRGNFSLEEERTIIQLHALLGNKWSTIAGQLPKRTDNEIKNYWNSNIKKRLIKMGIDPITHKPKRNNSTTIEEAHGGGDQYSKNTANVINHMAQWESVRVEAEARSSSMLQVGSSSTTRPARLIITKIPITHQTLRGNSSSESVLSTKHNNNAMYNSSYNMCAIMLTTYDDDAGDELQSPVSSVSCFPMASSRRDLPAAVSDNNNIVGGQFNDSLNQGGDSNTIIESSIGQDNNNMMMIMDSHVSNMQDDDIMLAVEGWKHLDQEDVGVFPELLLNGDTTLYHALEDLVN